MILFMIVGGGRVTIKVSKTLKESCLRNGAQNISITISPFQYHLHVLSLSKKHRKLCTMVEFSSQWYARFLWSNFGSITMNKFTFFLALHELVFIETLNTPSHLWLINVVVCLINETKATID